MATEKMFSVAGVSTFQGKTKLRFANDQMRIKILSKNGHRNTELFDLPHAMTKGEIAQYLVQVGFGAGTAEVEAAIAYTAKKNPRATEPTAVPVEADAA